ncbi:MAG: glycosyltransferase family 4 protein [Parachlamydiales bacterium]|nr:glycosyltransferase family 4 protein [Parachlamydiales bacterium]
MNILHLEASHGWGGQEIRILREAEGMRERGHTVILAVTRGGGLVSRAKNAGFIVYELNFRRASWPICLFQLLSIMRKHKIDLVNTHSSLDSWIGGIAARIARRSIVRTRHLSTNIKPGFNSRFVYGTLADFVVTTCSSILPMIVKQSGKSPDQCKSIATGVNPKLIQVTPGESVAFRKKWNIEADDFLVGTACFMRSWKGIDDLLKAADRLRDVPNLKWVIIGGGHAERHHRFAAELKLANVIFTGHLDHPFPAIAALDIFALLSTAHEGVSQAILQAAYLGKPLIATRTGGLGEVCIDQQTGLNVAPFSPLEVAEAVMKLKESSELRSFFGENAKRLVLEQFTLTHTLDEMEKVYRALPQRENSLW